MNNRIVLGLVLSIQVLCAAFFVWDILVTVLGIRSQPISWQIHEFIEIGAALGLVLGVLFGALALKTSLSRTRQAEDALKRAKGAFHDVMYQRFEDWSLTPAERDVALFAIKGFSTSDIAGLREVSEGTVKAQTNAIYRKAGVTGRPQLLSLFIEDLMDD